MAPPQVVSPLEELARLLPILFLEVGIRMMQGLSSCRTAPGTPWWGVVVKKGSSGGCWTQKGPPDEQPWWEPWCAFVASERTPSLNNSQTPR